MTTTTDTVAQPKSMRALSIRRLEKLSEYFYEISDDQPAGSNAYQIAEDVMLVISRLEAAEARVKELETAINQTIGWQESTDPMNAESVRLLVNVMQQKDGG